MSRRTAEASKAIRKAWENEQQLVAQGKGTRDWTEEQQRDILDENKGKAYDENGKAFEGHHMQSAEAHPEYQGDPGNIQFLTRQEHKDAHGGDFRNPTNGYYDPITHETTDFGDGKYVPCKEIELTNPVAKQPSVEKAEKEQASDSETSDIDHQREKLSDEKRNAGQQAGAENSQQRFYEKPHAKVEPELNWFEKGVKFLWDHRKNIAKGLGIAAAGAAAIAGGVSEYKKSRDGGSGSPDWSSDDNYNRQPSNLTSLDDSEPADDLSDTPTAFQERDYPDERASPREHTVSGYDRVRNGKVEHIDSYKRGGKKKEDEED